MRLVNHEGTKARRLRNNSFDVCLLLLTFVCFVFTPFSRPLYAQAPRSEMIPMRDGVRLATDVYLPEAAGPSPVILARTPYDKAGAAGIAKEAVMRGYAPVAQDTRGRYHSEGANLPFDSAGWAAGRMDGYDTLVWIG